MNVEGALPAGSVRPAGAELSNRVGCVLARLLTRDSWRVRQVADAVVSLDAGSDGEVSWFATGEPGSGLRPDLFVVDGEVLARAVLPAYGVLGCQASFERFEREMRGRSWVRLLLGTVLQNAAGDLPAVRAASMVEHPEPSTDVSSGDCFYAYAGSTLAAEQLATLIARLIAKPPAAK